MKNFVMPQINITEMSMNESIASECCFVLTRDGLNITSTILNGGDLGSKSITRWKKEVIGLKDSEYYSSIIAPCAHYYHYTYPKNSTSVWQNANSVYSGVEWWMDLSSTPDWDDYVMTGICNHGSSTSFNCPWITTEVQKNLHVGATVRHTMGGVNWSEPHRAYQFNS